jgi:hypothetical protein
MDITSNNSTGTTSSNSLTIWNIVLFLIITLLYFLCFKKKPTVTPETGQYTYEPQFMSLFLYYALILLVQWGLNIWGLSIKCGSGDTGSNFATAFQITFLNWGLLFGIMITLLVAFPGMKSAFSDVIGYYFISLPANELLTELMYNNVEDLTKAVTGVDGKVNDKTMNSTTEAISRVLGNKSILVNEVYLANFNTFFDMMNPLFKDKYHDTSKTIIKDGETIVTGVNTLLSEKKQEMLELVATRDNIGEGIWYIYIGTLLISICQFAIQSRPCLQTLEDMMKKQADYEEQEQQAIDAKNNATSTTYVMS